MFAKAWLAGPERPTLVGKMRCVPPVRTRPLRYVALVYADRNSNQNARAFTEPASFGLQLDMDGALVLAL